jgi:G3E family GTPase
MQPDFAEAQMQSARSSLGHRENIPLTIVGAPGIGKTSPVRHLSSTPRAGAAAIVSESVEIDPSLVAESDGWRVVLNNGCAYVAPTTTARRRSPRSARHANVLSTSSSIARASRMRRMTGYGYMPGYSLNGAVLVVDASNPALSDMDGTDVSHLQEQATIANVVLLNMVDRIDADRAAAAQRTLERLAPVTRVVWSDHGRIAPPLLLGLPVEPSALDARAVLAEWRPDYVPQHSRPARTKTCEAIARGASWPDAPIDGREFRAWAQRLTGRVMSGHGTVYPRRTAASPRLSFLGRRWRLDLGVVGRRPRRRACCSPASPGEAAGAGRSGRPEGGTTADGLSADLGDVA